MKHIITLLITFSAYMCAVSFCNAQFTGYTVELDTIFLEEGSVLEFFGTYRVYANFTNQNDATSALFSDVVAFGSPSMYIDAPCGCHNPVDGNVYMDATNPSSIWSAFPEWEYDTYWTIGMTASDDYGLLPSSIGMPAGNEICSATTDDGAVYVVGIPPNALAGENLRVLIAQVTTCGDWSLQTCISMFINADQNNMGLYCPDLLEVTHPYIDGECVNDTDGDGICDEFEIAGCYETAACNYNPDATDDSMDCDYSCYGCLDEEACNFVPVATIDDGTCEYPEQWYNCVGECISDVDNDGICDELEIIGCTDLEAYNYNSEATDSDNTLCIYFVPDCNNFGDPGWLDTESGTYPEQSFGVFGEMYNEDIALHLSTTIVEAGSGVSYTLESFDFTSMSGLPDGLIATMTVEQMTPNSEVCVNISGIPVETGVFDILFTGEAFINVFGNSIYTGVISFTHTLEIGDNPNPIPGCTYPGSDNYLVYAMVDDGTCIISGCTDPEASNFHPIFNLENGSCQYVEDVSDCIEDLNQDGTIGTPDLLQLLSAYGQNCE